MADREDFHLPSRRRFRWSTSFGVALMLFGFVPDSRLWRLAVVTLGAMITFVAGWLWLRDSMKEYRELD